MSRFSENLVRLQAEANISNRKLMEIADCTESTVGNWRKGRTTPRLYHLSNLAAFFGVSVDELLGEG